MALALSACSGSGHASQSASVHVEASASGSIAATFTASVSGDWLGTEPFRLTFLQLRQDGDELTGEVNVVAANPADASTPYSVTGTVRGTELTLIADLGAFGTATMFGTTTAGGFQLTIPNKQGGLDTVAFSRSDVASFNRASGILQRTGKTSG